MATGSILGGVLSIYPKKQNNSVENENNDVELNNVSNNQEYVVLFNKTQDLINQLKLVVKPKYLDKLNKLKEHSESNQKLLQDLYNDVKKFFEIDPMTNQNKNDSLSLYNAIVNNDFKEIQEYKNSIKVLENLKENDVTFEVINEVYNDQFKVANELNVLKATFDILKSRSRNLKNTNKELKFINQVQGLDFKNKSIDSIRNEINGLVDDAISLNHYDQEIGFNNPFVNLHSYLTSFANQIDRDFVATPYFEEWRTEPTPVDVRKK